MLKRKYLQSRKGCLAKRLKLSTIFHAAKRGGCMAAAEAVSRGAYYASHSDIQERRHAHFFSKELILPGDKILDIGCGDGRFTERYAELSAPGSVVGIDASEAMIAWAQERYQARFNLSFQPISALDLVYEDAFDKIYSSNCLHWVPHHEKVLKNIARALKPGAHCLLLFSSPSALLRPIDSAVKGAVTSPKWRPFFDGGLSYAYAYRKELYARWALHAGFSQFTLQEICAEDSFVHPSEFVSWIMGWLPHLNVLPHALHAHFAEEIVFRYMQYEGCVDSNQRILFKQTLYLLKGSKRIRESAQERTRTSTPCGTRT